MYTLRIIEEKRKDEKSSFEQIIENQELGDAYTVFHKGITKEFDSRMDTEFKDFDKSQVRALVVGSNGKSFFILNNKDNYQNTYYIMTDGGKTLERL